MEFVTNNTSGAGAAKPLNMDKNARETERKRRSQLIFGAGDMRSVI